MSRGDQKVDQVLQHAKVSTGPGGMRFIIKYRVSYPGSEGFFLGV